MDAASKIKLVIIGSALSLAGSTNLRGDDNRPNDENRPCTSACAKLETKDACGCDKNPESIESKSRLSIHSPDKDNTTGSLFVELVSDWLSKSPKFSAQLAIHFDRVEPGHAKVVSDLPAIEISGLSNDEDATTNPALARPMKFRQTITAAQLGEFVSDVIACGHRICTGNKCYDVNDEPVKGTHCDTTPDLNLTKVEKDDPEEIVVVPMAPPAPPGQDIAYYAGAAPGYESTSIPRNCGLNNVKVQVPVETIIDLVVAKTTLSTRLELTEQMMQERLSMHEQLYELSERNARLATQLAVTEAKQQFSDALTANLIERTELAMKIAAEEPKVGRFDSSTTVKAIQEDLSNIRRQIALLKKSQPVPFAPSFVGTPVRPYVPTAQLMVPPQEVDHDAASQADRECGTEIELPVATKRSNLLSTPRK